MSNGILVTGGAGFIGHHLVRRLSTCSERKIVVIDNLSNANPNFRIDEFRDVAFYNEDIRNREKVADIIRQEQVGTCVHLAAKISVNDSIADPSSTVDVNVNGTLSVLNACAQHQVNRFIFASSAAVYGDVSTVPVVENQELTPLSPYGASKVAGEMLVNTFTNGGKIPQAVTLRFFNVYGPGQSPEYAGVITRFAERLSQGLPPIIYGRGDQTRDFVAVEDVVHSIILAVETRRSGLFNIGTGIATSISELATKLLLLYGLDLTPTREAPRPGDILQSYADISNARELLKFSPSHELFETLATMLGLSSKTPRIVTN